MHTYTHDDFACACVSAYNHMYVGMCWWLVMRWRLQSSLSTSFCMTCKTLTLIT